MGDRILRNARYRPLADRGLRQLSKSPRRQFYLSRPATKRRWSARLWNSASAKGFIGLFNVSDEARIGVFNMLAEKQHVD
jgi:hypothetical protein